jgi:hypothetical protein
MEGPGWGYRSDPEHRYRTQSSGMKPVSEAVCARASSKSVEGEGVLAFTQRHPTGQNWFVAIGAVCNGGSSESPSGQTLLVAKWVPASWQEAIPGGECAGRLSVQGCAGLVACDSAALCIPLLRMSVV